MKTLWATLLGLLCASSLTWAAAPQLVDWQTQKPQTLYDNSPDIKVLNVWATWCAPCRKEIPELNRWHQQQQKSKLKPRARVFSVALDEPKNIAKFIQEVPIVYPVWQLKGDSAQWFKTIGNVSGGVPFTLVYSERCRAQEPIYGLVNANKLDQAVAKVRQQCLTAKK
ncbi:MAG: TlpA family protein disulfide reductase [Neisseriaceae bacterium]|nr:TlpA family protein disulfide reductase [Neisseriaceae bacterium]